MDCLILRFDAPLMSFGAVVVDQINPVWRFPGRSMLAGLLGNALGWEHRDVERLQHLQERLRFAARWDAEPVPFTDYQTVELGQPFMVDTGWTTRGRREDRKGGSAATGTHQRWRDFWANGVATVAIALDGEDSPTLDDLERALQRPARPLFIGRKPCLPSGPILIGRRQADGVKDALVHEQRADVGPRRQSAGLWALWPVDEDPGGSAGLEEFFDRRDWMNNIHTGSERFFVGILEVKA
jgi:CRISPR system Cascade subunit CasD